MPKTLIVIADMSGSMAAAGKPGILRLALRTASYLAAANGVALQIYAVNGDGLHEISGVDGLPTVSGRMSLASLIPLIEAIPSGTEFCLLSDGFFDKQDESADFIKRCKDKQISLFCFAVGADSKIKWFSGKNAPSIEKVSDIAEKLREICRNA